MIRALFLDIGGVLLDFDHSIAWRRLAGEARVDVEEVREFLVDKGLVRRFELGEVGKVEFFRLTKRRFALSISAAAFQCLWADIFTLKTEVVTLLPGLASAVPLIVLSNTDPVHHGHIEKTYTFLAYFKAKVLSYEEGVRKPDEGIYRVALQRARRLPEECLFFDDMEPNVSAARRLGIQAHLFTGVEGMKGVLRDCGLSVG